MKHKYDHGFTPSPYLTSSVREGKLFLYPLRFCNWDMQIKLTKDRFTGEKKTFSTYIYCRKCGSEKTLEFGAYTILRRRGGGEGALMEKGMTFGKDKGAPGE